MMHSCRHPLLLLTAFSLLLASGVHAQQIPDAKAEQPKPKPPTVLTDAAFDRADADHNGMLDAHEFASFTSSIKKALDPYLNIYGAGQQGNDNELLQRVAGGGNALGNKPAARLRAGGVNKFWSGFMSGILTIWATEIGDKTFFIAAILSMKQDRVVVFAGAIGALIVMTVLSVVMGVVATKFLPPNVTHYLGAVLVRRAVCFLPLGFYVIAGFTDSDDCLCSCYACSLSYLVSRCSTTRARCRRRTLCSSSGIFASTVMCFH